MTVTHHLAQLNIGRLRAPLDDPQIADFQAQLAPVNALAEAAPGFVWRLQDAQTGDATSFRPFEGDPLMMINCSVWESLEALWDFVYRTVHLDSMRRRREWFHRLAEAYTVLWWVPAGHLPTVGEALDRLARLRTDGPGPEAFTFAQPHPAPVAVDR
jgi:hypothetical protein